jgi:maltose alpha-D-glucosyltransferase/alpha-amylase
LNFDNPHVLKAVLQVMRFWLRLGVDGLRLDAVPYLIEREETSNENLAETHQLLKRFRAEVDASFPGTVLLAEANQWPEDTKEYFGEGDECHMAFHFPLMPRMYMAIAREDRFPISDIIRQTPAIPENCQWAVFLRNHDELTLEMVTDSERDYLWETYAADRRARINLGIRRRLAPLLERDRRRVELMNNLLLSMPGTPVIYYGDEIGMGDNIHLGDRDGVRTPMQWSPDRNGGFSRADPAALVLPAIMDPLYGYEAVNVEAQSRDPHSILNWMRRTLAVRRRHAAFGRGTLTLLYPRNRKILAYLREYRGDTVLCVANVAHSPQAVELDLSQFAGRVPVELNAGTLFPPIGQLTYLLTLPPYGFYWFALEMSSDSPSWHTPAPEPMPEYVTLVMRNNLAQVVSGASRALLENEVLPQYLLKRRWFGAKDQAVESVRIGQLASIPGCDREVLLCEIEAKTGRQTSRWLLPLSVYWEGEPVAALPAQLALAGVRSGRRVGFVTDAFALPSFGRGVVAAIANDVEVPLSGDTVRFERNRGAPQSLTFDPDAEVNWISAEQSNSSLTVGDAVMLKLFRRIAAGEHPEAEMGRALTARGFEHAPPLFGEIVRVNADGECFTLGVAQGFVRNQGDAWSWMLDYLKRAIDALGMQDAADEKADLLTDCESFSATIGRRLGEMHLVLAQSTDDQAFAPAVATAADASGWAERAEQRLQEALDAISERGSWERSEDEQRTKELLALRKPLASAIRRLAQSGKGSVITRVHGDFHLGQVLVASGDAYMIDFEGEPTRPLAERRAKASPLRDVAGLLRSIDYAAAAIVEHKGVGAAPVVGEPRDELIAQFRKRVSRAFLDAYRAAVGSDGGERERRLLELFLIEKAAYEITYEAANRPTWIGVPLAGLSTIANRVVNQRAGAQHVGS